MKTKIPIYILFFALIIAGVNICLWYSPAISSEKKGDLIPELNEQVLSVKNAEQGALLSSDAEYPAPVKQLQQALAKAFRDNELVEVANEDEIEAVSVSVIENAAPPEELEELKDRLARLKRLVNEK